MKVLVFSGICITFKHVYTEICEMGVFLIQTLPWLMPWRNPHLPTPPSLGTYAIYNGNLGVQEGHPFWGERRVDLLLKLKTLKIGGLEFRVNLGLLGGISRANYYKLPLLFPANFHTAFYLKSYKA